jgi:hypothetical protein
VPSPNVESNSWSSASMFGQRLAQVRNRRTMSL